MSPNALDVLQHTATRLQQQPAAPTLADLAALYQQLTAVPIRPFGLFADRQAARIVETVGHVLQRFCFEAPGIGNPQYARINTLSPAQLAPARAFTDWAIGTLATTDWADAAAAHRAWVLWQECLGVWSFSDWGLLLVVPDLLEPLSAVLARLLQGPNVALTDDVRLGHLLGAILNRTLREAPPAMRREPPQALVALYRLVPTMLRFEQCSNDVLELLARHPEAPAEIAAFVDLCLTATTAPAWFHDSEADTGYTTYTRSYLGDFLHEPAAVKQLKAFELALRPYLARWTQAQLRTFAEQVLQLPQLLVGYDPLKRQKAFVGSPNRRRLLALVQAHATAPELLTLLGQVQTWLAAQLPARPARRAAPAPATLADFNLKLLVVRELILQGEALPGLTRVLARPRNALDFSYAPLKAALTAYQRLRLTQAHYDKVERLEPDASDIWDLNIINNWDGADDQFDIRSLAGIGCLRNLRVFNPINLLQVDDFSPLLDCPRLEEARITDFVDADSDVVRALRARGVRVD